MPVNILIEPCKMCNLQCPGCAVGVKHGDVVETGMLTYENFKRIFDQIKDFVMRISLFKYGEPFLNKDIFRMVSYASSNKCGVTIHSNFNIFNESMAEEAVKSRLTHIYVALDGATQETYEGYRKGGDISRVLENVETLIRVKKKMRSTFPLVTWKYLVFPENAHEIESARQKAKELGVNAFEVFAGNLDDVTVFGREKRYDIKTGQIVTHTYDFCPVLWDSLYINPDGSVVPCCQAFREKDVFGNIFEHSLKEVWNNDDFVAARRIVSIRKIDEGLRDPCRGCQIIQNFSKS
jgi:radical SAM protein with 4Fe4S-binding SPASM domain